MMPRRSVRHAKHPLPLPQPKRQLRPTSAPTVVVENVNHPGKTRVVDATRYGAMRRAILKVLPSTPPGLTLDEACAAVLRYLPDALFPHGAHAGWWFKTVQLDLEAKHVIARERTRPLRVYVSKGRREHWRGGP